MESERIQFAMDGPITNAVDRREAEHVKNSLLVSNRCKYIYHGITVSTCI